MRKLIILIILLLILIGALVIIFWPKNITSKIIEENEAYYSFTKAICDEKNYCQDNEITCRGSKIISINPTGAAIQFPEEWEDLRNQETIDKLCE